MRWRHFLLGGWGNPLSKKLETQYEPIKIFIVKENHIDSAVSEILRYKQKKLTTFYNRIKIIERMIYLTGRQTDMALYSCFNGLVLFVEYIIEWNFQCVFN